MPAARGREPPLAEARADGEGLLGLMLWSVSIASGDAGPVAFESGCFQCIMHDLASHESPSAHVLSSVRDRSQNLARSCDRSNRHFALTKYSLHSRFAVENSVSLAGGRHQRVTRRWSDRQKASPNVAFRVEQKNSTPL